MNKRTNKTVWQKYGKWIISSVGAFLVIYSGIQISDYYQTKETLKASVLYDEMMAAMQKMDNESAMADANTLTQEYRKTPYAQLANLLLAKLFVDQSKWSEAILHLRSALKGNEKNPMGQVAKIRLARVLASQGDYEEALTVLSSKTLENYAVLFEETKGDIFLLQGEKTKAIDAYNAAIKAAPPNISLVRIQAKLDDIDVEGGV